MPTAPAQDTDAFRIGLDEEDDAEDENPADPLPDMRRSPAFGMTRRRVPERYR